MVDWDDCYQSGCPSLKSVPAISPRQAVFFMVLVSYGGRRLVLTR